MHLTLSERDAGPAPAHAEPDELTVRVMRGGIRAAARISANILRRSVRAISLSASARRYRQDLSCGAPAPSEALQTDRVRRIVLVRPAVEAGERLGFLPGDLTQKVDPYLRPMYDALYEMMGFDRVARFIERNVIRPTFRTGLRNSTSQASEPVSPSCDQRRLGNMVGVHSVSGSRIDCSCLRVPFESNRLSESGSIWIVHWLPLLIKAGLQPQKVQQRMQLSDTVKKKFDLDKGARRYKRRTHAFIHRDYSLVECVANEHSSPRAPSPAQ